MKKKDIKLKTYKVYATNKSSGKLVPLFSLRSVSENIAFERIYIIFENKLKEGFEISKFDKLFVYVDNVFIYEDNLVGYLRKHALI